MSCFDTTCNVYHLMGGGRFSLVISARFADDTTRCVSLDERAETRRANGAPRIVFSFLRTKWFSCFRFNRVLADASASRSTFFRVNGLSQHTQKNFNFFINPPLDTSSRKPYTYNKDSVHIITREAQNVISVSRKGTIHRTEAGWSFLQ